MRNLRMCLLARLLVVALLPLYAFSAASRGAEVHLVAAGESIQAAIDAASDGDGIYLSGSTYTESFDLKGKGLFFAGDSIVRIQAPEDGGSIVRSVVPTEGVSVFEGIFFEEGEGELTAGDRRLGGAVYCVGARMVFRGCQFLDNSADDGGAIFATDGSVIEFHDVQVRGGLAERGGGIFLQGSTLIGYESRVTGNSAVETGGGIHAEMASSLRLYDTRVSGSAGRGGAIFMLDCPELEMTASRLSSSDSATSGGQIHCEGVANCTFTRTSFTDGASSGLGGGASFIGCGEISFTEVWQSGHSAVDGGWLHVDGADSLRISRSSLSSARAQSAGGFLHIRDVEIVTMTDCGLSSGEAMAVGGAIDMHGGRLELRGITFTDFVAANGGGGALRLADAECIAVNCEFTRCASTEGGAISVTGGTMSLIQAVVRVCEAANIGGAAFISGGAIDLESCTIFGNGAEASGGVYASGADVTVSNSILWANRGTGGQIDVTTGSVVVKHSCVEGGHPGVGNTDANPGFIRDANAGFDLVWGTEDDFAGDFRLATLSPIRGTGMMTELSSDILDLDQDGDVGEPIPLDFQGYPRVTRRCGDASKLMNPGASEWRQSTGVETLPPSAILFVDQSASGSGCGGSWVDAAPDLAAALRTAKGHPEIVEEIHIAAGTYFAGRLSDVRETTFEVADGLHVLGGFPQGGASPLERDPSMHRTILSGDLARNDNVSGDALDDNTDHVVSILGAVEGVILDGVMIRGGRPRSNGEGRALRIEDSTVELRDCLIESQASVFAMNSVVSFIGCTFPAVEFDGIYAEECDLAVIGCAFEGRDSSTAVRMGAGTLEVIDSQFRWLDEAVSHHFLKPSSASVVGCIFEDVLEPILLGDEDSYVSVRDCLLSRSGPVNVLGNGEVVDCTLVNPLTGVIWNAVSFAVTFTMTGCEIVSDGLRISGSSILRVGSDDGRDLVVSDCVFSGLRIRFFDSALEIDGGGEGPVVVDRCRFSGNLQFGDHENDGGGALYSEVPNLILTNCVFEGNSTGANGGAVWSDGADPIANCTFVNNTAGGRGTILVGQSARIENCAFKNNRDRDGVDGDSSVALRTHSTVGEVNWSCIPGGWSGDGVGTIDADPMFLNPEAGDWRLAPGSPCIDAGDSSAVPPDFGDADGDGDLDEPVPFDHDGHPRLVDAVAYADMGPPSMFAPVDIGAFEAAAFYPADPGCPGDADGSGAIDFGDLNFVLDYWGASVTPGMSGDVTFDGSVDILDLQLILEFWSAACR